MRDADELLEHDGERVDAPSVDEAHAEDAHRGVAGGSAPDLEHAAGDAHGAELGRIEPCARATRLELEKAWAELDDLAWPEHEVYPAVGPELGVVARHDVLAVGALGGVAEPRLRARALCARGRVNGQQLAALDIVRRVARTADAVQLMARRTSDR